MFAIVNNSNSLTGLAIKVSNDASLSTSPTSYYMGDVNITDAVRVLSISNVSSINVATSNTLLGVNGTFENI